MTNSPTKPVAPLSEEQVSVIEARALQVKELIGVGQFGEDMLRLCQSLRAARNEAGVALDLCNVATEALRKSEAENAALREQLAHLQSKPHLLTCGARIEGLEEQLAQVEKERDEVREQLGIAKEFIAEHVGVEPELEPDPPEHN